MIKCLLLKTGITLISEMLEVGAEVGEPDCQLINPCQILENGEFSRWPTCTDQKTLMLGSDNFLTIADPSQEILNKYKEVTG
jgi:hypothetical protein|tara:strand:- start:1221 stop:1466 length:246 start_codon:yes stop_codon:yes gene_type:complete